MKRNRLSNYIKNKIKEGFTEHSNKIDLAYLSNSKLRYLNKIKLIKFKTPVFETPRLRTPPNYDQFFKLCCFSTLLDYRLVKSDMEKIPDLLLWVFDNEEIKNICLSEMTELQIIRLYLLLDCEHTNCTILREKSLINRLIVDNFRMQRRRVYSKRLKEFLNS